MAVATRTELVQGSAEWLAARADGIGSSDMPVIARESPYRSPYQLWAEKCRLVEPEQPDAATRELMDIGKAMEPVLLNLYEARTGRKARRVPRTLAHPELPWARASLDAEAPVRRIVEAKWTHARRWSQGDAVPPDVLIQVQWQMFVTGRQVVDVVALVGPELRVVDIPRDDAMIDDLAFLAADFWQHVQDGTPPTVDGSDSTRRALARIHPVNDGRLLDADPAIDGLVASLSDLKAAVREREAEIGTIENTLRALIGDADGFIGPWGRLTWKRNADSTRTNWPAVAKAYRLALEEAGMDPAELEALVSINSETSPGPRVLRLSQKGSAA